MEWKKFATESAGEVFGKLRTSRQGLNETDAKRRLLEYGKNSLEESEPFFWRVFQRRAHSLLAWILFLVAIITLFTGEYFEALLIFLFLVINIGLEIFQEFHSEKALKILQHYTVSETRVWREGLRIPLKASLLVPGDCIEIRAGDRVPADIRLLEAEGLLIDESILTGEKGSVAKNTDVLQRSPGNVVTVQNIAYAGSGVLSGKGVGIVVATGRATALGSITHHIAGEADKETAFESHIREFSSFLVKLLIAALVLVFFLYSVIHGQSVPVLEMFLFTLVLAITVVPEAFPTITAVALSRGSLQLAKQNVIIKRPSAIEDLGSIEILCIDKTGIITEDKLLVSHIYGDNKQNILQQALLAAHGGIRSQEESSDAFDRALLKEVGEGEVHELKKITRVAELPFEKGTRFTAVITQEHQQKNLIVRGAPEEVLRKISHLDAYTRKHIFDWIKEAGLRGERVLAVATKENYTNADFGGMSGLQFVGLVSFLDPLKKDAKKATEDAKKLGVQIKIFSGDSKEVVGASAYAAGVIEEASQVVLGSEFENLSLPEQIHTLETRQAFARFSPDQKYAALKLLQKTHTVAFFGEGVGDVASLKLAHVAVAIEQASDVAREASDILLLQKDLQALVSGIRESRRVFANILKYLKITLAANFGNFYSISLAALFLPYLPLLPIQILLLNLLSDFPMLAIATDRVDPEKLERPNNHNMHSIVVTATIFGVASSFFDLTIFRIFSYTEPSELQTAWFVFSVISEIILLYSLRTRRWFFRGERSSWPISCFTVLAILAAIIIPFTWFGSALSFKALSFETILLLGGLLVVYFIVTEIIKRWYYMHSAFFVGNGKV